MADPSNPFAAIFSTPEAVERQVSSAEQQRRDVGRVLRRVFLISPTVSDSPGRVESRASRPRYVLALPGVGRDLQRSGTSTSDLDLDSLAKGVAERLQMDDPLASLVRCQHGRSSGLYSEARAVETCNLTYLAHSYTRACQEEASDSKMDVVVHSHVLEECKRVVVEMCGGVLMQMAHYERFVAIFIQSIRQPDDEAVPVEFFYRIAEVYQSDPQKLKRLFEPPLGTVTSAVPPLSYSSQTLHYSVAVLGVYGGNPVLGKVCYSFLTVAL
ncbi:hypothetical protein GBAR_LOCUS17927 [Geodia barretti]|uniref:Uncharacterized protein n=1 Tax=Geodia barretti TaxID=519541 RepID=A0AA35SK56_GEOBA|nr:hypothetical protein GBAR_LOCUS17927 [Geodia barretti]